METNNKFFLYDAYVFSFKNVLAQVRIFILSFLVFMAAFIPVAGIAVFLNKSLLFALLSPARFHQLYLASSLSMSLFFTVLILLFIYWAAIGTVRISLAIHDEGTSSLKKVFPPLFMFFKAVIALSLLVAIAFVGFVCLIIPGIYWIIRTWFLLYAIADGEGIFEAFSTSFRITRGKEWYIFSQLLAGSILGKLSILTLPFVLLSNAYLYRYLKKENE